MAKYRLISNGVLRDEGLETEAHIPNDPNNTDWQAYLAWLAEPNTPDPIIEQPTSNTKKFITRLAFLNRFTINEQIALELTSVDNPNAPSQQRQLEAMLRVFMRNVNSATYIDLTRQDVIQGINNLATYGLLSQERASNILNNPILPEEVYKP